MRTPEGESTQRMVPGSGLFHSRPGWHAQTEGMGVAQVESTPFLMSGRATRMWLFHLHVVAGLQRRRGIPTMPAPEPDLIFIQRDHMPDHASRDSLPPLARDVAFLGMTATQFLGAFNDNLFKQLVLLLCVDYAVQAKAAGDIHQTMAQALFALPFVMFSGFAGFLSDRMGKRSIIVISKVAEIFVMLAGLAVLWRAATGSPALLYGLFAVLCLMGTQSAFFGPSKYGVLPEMFREGDLPVVNGLIQMTTFLAIIFGTAAAGYAKMKFEDDLWIVSGLCVLIATSGTATSLLLRRTPAARPGLRFSADAVAISVETRQLLRREPTLRTVLLIVTLFWFVGGVILPTVNSFGRRQIGLEDDQTSLLAACMGIGIATGCALAGALSKHRVRFVFVRVGAFGLTASLALVGVLPYCALTQSGLEWAARGGLISVGIFGGFYAVPLQVYLQAKPPEAQKGRMIGAMNLLTWIGILLSAGFYFACSWAFTETAISGTFLVLSALLLPVALFFHPPETELVFDNG